MCRTPKHLVDLYQASIRGRRPHANVAETYVPDNIEANTADTRPRRAFDVADFVEAPVTGPEEPCTKKTRTEDVAWWQDYPTRN